MASIEESIEVVVRGLKLDSNDAPERGRDAPSSDHWLNYYHESLGDLGVYVLQGDTTSNDVVRDIVRTEDVIDIEKPIFLTNLDQVLERYHLWKRELPNVEIFYAIKTYDSPVMVQLFRNLDCGFEVASKAEAEHCLHLGVKPERIVCNHPYKLGPHLQYLAVSDVRVLSVDSPDELTKLATIFPDADLLLRVVPADDALDEGFHFDVKFGATEDQAQELLKKGKSMGLNFVGVAFHVGSATKDDTVHERSLELAKRLFDFAKTLGYDFNILDIGGGFPGGSDADEFQRICARLRPALEHAFPDAMNVRVIAEPGRYFATSAITDYACVMGRRQLAKCKLEKTVDRSKGDATLLSDPDALDSYIYVLNDGIWGSMNYILAEDDYQPLKVLNPRRGAELAPCIIWGPTCDSLDRITGMYNSEILQVGDWVYRTNAGAYAHTMRTTFNGMPHPRYVFTIKEENLHWLKKNGAIKMPYI